LSLDGSLANELPAWISLGGLLAIVLGAGDDEFART
jgi:hypothetical protein